jgi:hypothetical protein
VVIATQMAHKPLATLDAICREHGVLLVALRSYGLTGTVRLSLGEHAVIEAKPEESDHDLRLSHPWPVGLSLPGVKSEKQSANAILRYKPEKSGITYMTAK